MAKLDASPLDEQDHHSHGPGIRVGRRVGHHDDGSSAASNGVEESGRIHLNAKASGGLNHVLRDELVGAANRSLSHVEPVSGTPQRKSENGAQRLAPETHRSRTENLEIAEQRLGHASLTRPNLGSLQWAAPLNTPYFSPRRFGGASAVLASRSQSSANLSQVVLASGLIANEALLPSRYRVLFR
jgi:hypothetical protein